MKKQFNVIAIIGTSILMLSTSLASAQEAGTYPENSWDDFDMSMRYSGSAYTKTQRATIDKGEVIYTTDANQNGVMFTCLAGRLYVAASVEPRDFRETFLQASSRRKYKYVDMRLNDGKKIGLGTWIYKPSLDSISSMKRPQAAKLYNAVIRKQKVTLFVSSKKPIMLNLPKPNQTFAEFGAACGLGKYAKKK